VQFAAELKQITEIKTALAAAMATAETVRKTDRIRCRAALDEAAWLRSKGGVIVKQIDGRAALPLTKAEAKTWRRAAFGSDEKYSEMLAALAPSVQRVGEWVTDEQGIKTRTITSSDSKAAAAT
jgi:hypothetical protein